MYKPKMNNDGINNIITIIKLSENGMSNIKKGHNKNLLERLWNWYKIEINDLYRKCGYDEYVENELPDINFLLNPNITDGYDPTDNKLKFHLWTFFLSSVANNKDYPICFEPIFKRAAEILHELDHYFFIKEHDAIGMSDEERKEFDKEFGQELEKRAYEKMHIFYEIILDVLPQKYPIYLFNKDIIKKEYVIPKKEEQNTKKLIKNIKNQIENEIQKIEKSYDVYSGAAEGIAFGRVKNIADLFDFNIIIKNEEKDYEIVQIKY